MKQTQARKTSILLVILYVITALPPSSLVLCRSAEGRVAAELGYGNSCLSSVVYPRDRAREATPRLDRENLCDSCSDAPLSIDKEHLCSRGRKETLGGDSPCCWAEADPALFLDRACESTLVSPTSLADSIPLPVRSVVLLI